MLWIMKYLFHVKKKTESCLPPFVSLADIYSVAGPSWIHQSNIIPSFGLSLPNNKKG